MADAALHKLVQEIDEMTYNTVNDKSLFIPITEKTFICIEWRITLNVLHQR